jgi:sulfite reductase alpha subunit-like flavoprotein
MRLAALSRALSRAAAPLRHFSSAAAAAFPSASPAVVAAMPLLPSVRVLFGSQTGTAMAFASQLADDLGSSAGVQATASDLYEYDASALPAETSAAVFVVSCFGRGEPTDSAKKFYAWAMDPARSAGGARPLKGLRYAVFGLGSSETHSAYYNIVGRNLDARLSELGATRIFARGEGDDSKWRVRGLLRPGKGKERHWADATPPVQRLRPPPHPQPVSLPFLFPTHSAPTNAALTSTSRPGRRTSSRR